MKLKLLILFILLLTSCLHPAAAPMLQRQSFLSDDQKYSWAYEEDGTIVVVSAEERLDPKLLKKLCKGPCTVAEGNVWKLFPLTATSGDKK